MDDSAFHINNDTVIWKINIPEQTNNAKEHFLYLLSPSERAKSERFKKESDCDRYVVTRIATRVILGRYMRQQPDKLLFHINESGKPEVAGGPFFNISHSGSYVVIACSAGPVGIDIEYIQPDFSYQSVLETCFSHIEQQQIKQSNDKLHSFYAAWTRKEAVTKWKGMGIKDELRTISIAVREGLTSLDIDDCHVGAIAYMPHFPLEKIRSFTFTAFL